MRQTLGFIAVWCGATALAISVAWFGVRDVLRSEVFDDVAIEPLDAALVRTADAPLPAAAPSGPQPAGPPAASGASRRTASPRPTPAAPAEDVARPRRTPSKIRVAPADTRAPDAAGTTASPTPFASGATRAAEPAASPTSAPPTRSFADENVRVVDVKGGSVSFVIENGVCRLIAAAPAAGYEAKVASATGWIRVDLVRGQHGSAVFCIGGENRTDLWEY
ncbi:hypothetical protein GCM10010517_57490 [Streptosporangium fragile]|uniref:Secreted protein n=1 Tax=Streptosporangium fragile TaxID=46186 RepID=A0ABN3W6X0_9ACTN